MAALQYLERQRAAQPELAEWYTSMADLYERKLWHQLTLKLDQFVALTVFQVCDCMSVDDNVRNLPMCRRLFSFSRDWSSLGFCFLVAFSDR